MRNIMDKLFSVLLKHLEDGECNKIESILTPEVVHMSDKNGTLLQYAANKGKTDIVKCLIKFGADLNVRRGFGCTPVMLAIQSHEMDVLKILLLAGADVLIEKDRLGNRNAVEIAMEDSQVNKIAISLMYRQLCDENINNEKLSEKLIAADCNMFHAAAFGDIKLLEFMLSQGVDINSKGGRQRTAIHAAAALDNLIMASWLMDRGADINARDKSGVCALTVCAERGHKDILELLLKRGADPNSEDYDDERTPLFAVFDNEKGKEELNQFTDCAMTLLLYGAIPRNTVYDDMKMVDYGLVYNMHETVKVIVSYVAMLRALGNDVDDDVISCGEPDNEESASTFNKYHEECLEVLERHFFQEIPLAHFLKIDDAEFKKLVLKESFNTGMMVNADTMYKKSYPLYHKLLIKRINKAMHIIQCERKAAKILGFFFNANQSHEFDLPVNKIIGYLNIHDLETLIRINY